MQRFFFTTTRMQGGPWSKDHPGAQPQDLARSLKVDSHRGCCLRRYEGRERIGGLRPLTLAWGRQWLCRPTGGSRRSASSRRAALCGPLGDGDALDAVHLLGVLVQDPLEPLLQLGVVVEDVPHCFEVPVVITAQAVDAYTRNNYKYCKY